MEEWMKTPTSMIFHGKMFLDLIKVALKQFQEFQSYCKNMNDFKHELILPLEKAAMIRIFQRIFWNYMFPWILKLSIYLSKFLFAFQLLSFNFVSPSMNDLRNYVLHEPHKTCFGARQFLQLVMRFSRPDTRCRFRNCCYPV